MNRIHFVGAGTPTPTSSRFGTCYVLELGPELLMFDCGPAATHKMVRMGLFPTRIDHLFFSHQHFDHNADLPCFLLCRWDQSVGRENTLKIWGPPPTALVADRLIGPRGAFVHDWQARVGHPGSQDIFKARGGTLPRPEPRVEVNEIDAGQVVETDRWRVECARARHNEPFMPTLAYRIEAHGLSLVLTSDTGLCRAVTELARGARDMVVHCWDHQDRMAEAEAGMITGTLDAARLARDGNVSNLILSHLGPGLEEPDRRKKALSEMSALYKGRIVFADELSTISLEE